MNNSTVIILPLLALLILAAAEPQTRQESLTLKTLAHVLSLREAPKRCKPRMVFRTLGCLCFISFEKSLITSSLQESCMTLFGRPARNLRGRCKEFVIGGRLRPFKAVAKGRRIQEQCFVEIDMLDLPPGADAPGRKGGVPVKTILERLGEIRALLDDVLSVLDVMLVLPSTPARVIPVGEGVKAMRLIAYNGIDGARE